MKSRSISPVGLIAISAVISLTTALTAGNYPQGNSPSGTYEAANYPYAEQIVTISDTLIYGGPTAPTGEVTFTLNGSAYTATCTGAGSPRTCTYAVPSTTIAALTTQGYTVTAAYTADANYNDRAGLQRR